jgi:acetylglutamate kinase
MPPQQFATSHAGRAPVTEALGGHCRRRMLPCPVLLTCPDGAHKLPRFGHREYDVLMINTAINKASALVEALSYIQRFHNKVVVVKIGGSIMDDEQVLSTILTDIVFMNYVGMQPILVHGGGKAINQAMEAAGLKPQMVLGRRYTDERTLAIAEHVLCNQINRFIVNFIQSQGCEAMGLHSLSSVVLFAEKTYVQQPDGRRVDLGYVGEVTSVNARLLQLLVQADSIPCIATIARDQAGGKLNVNADTAAGAVAAAMKAEKLVVVSDTHGIRRDVNDPESRISHLTVAQIDELVKTGVITSGMLPKVEACVTALRGGVNKAHIIDGRIPHALLLEIYTEAGIGTEIVL